MRTLVALALVLALLSGCKSTGVVPMGPDTFMLAKQGTAMASGNKVKAALYVEADAWCKARGLVMVPLTSSAKDGVPGARLASAELTFRAVPPGDPENRRVTMEAVPDVVVELRDPPREDEPEQRGRLGDRYSSAELEAVALEFAEKGRMDTAKRALEEAQYARERERREAAARREN